MKRTFLTSLSAGMLILCMSAFASAQYEDVMVSEKYPANYCTTQSTICGSAPEQFMNLMDFVREMSNSIKTIGTASPYLGKYVNPNRFKGTLFSPPPQPFQSKLVTNLLQKATFSIATIAILASPVNLAGLKDMFGGIALLTKNNVFLRDSKIVERTQSIVTEKQYQLGLGGGWTATVNPENQKIMRDIIQKYVDKGLLEGGTSKISSDVTYSQVTSLMLQILSAAKGFLSLGTRKGDFGSLNPTKGLHVTLDTGAGLAIQTDYLCARGSNNVCSAQHMKVKDVFSQLFSSITSKEGRGMRSLKTIKDATDRLMGIFLQDNGKNQDNAERIKKYQERQQSLLVSMYGTKDISVSTGFKGLLIDPFKKTRTDIKESAVDSYNDIKNDIRTYRTISQDLKTTVDNIPSPSHLTEDPLLANLVTKSIDAYIADVLASQAVDLEIASLSEVQGVTPSFLTLSRQIATIKNIIGTKENDKTIANNLGVACEKQCGRGGRCY